jgi:hypothetical protein
MHSIENHTEIIAQKQFPDVTEKRFSGRARTGFARRAAQVATP